MYFITNKDAFVYDSISIDVLKVTLYPIHNAIFFDDTFTYCLSILTIFQYDFPYALGYILVIQRYI
jgi:hypothetical protein